MRYLIIGRTASGKDTLAEKLVADYDFTAVKSATTRPKRSDEEDTHIFVTPDEAAAETDKVAQTTIGDYEYYATRAAVEAADIYVIDPDGARELSLKMPDDDFHIVYMSVAPEKRKEKFVERAMAGDPNLSENDAAELFEQREASEDERFSAFEGLITTDAKLETWGFGESIRAVHVLENDYDEDTMDAFARMLRNLTVLLKRTTALIPVACENGLLSGVDNKILMYDNTKGEQYVTSAEWCADTIIADDKAMLAFLKGLLMTLSDAAVVGIADLNHIRDNEEVNTNADC